MGAVKINTQEEYNKVMTVFEEKGYVWWNQLKPTQRNYFDLLGNKLKVLFSQESGKLIECDDEKLSALTVEFFLNNINELKKVN